MKQFSNRLFKFALDKIRPVYQRKYGRKIEFTIGKSNHKIKDQDASDLIFSKLKETKPLMISRFGSTEIEAVLNYYFISDKFSFVKKITNYLDGAPFLLDIEPHIVGNMIRQSGFFPAEKTEIIKFAKMSLTDLTEIDVLASWLSHEMLLFEYLNEPDFIYFEDLFPFYQERPWSMGLENKTVLVIHPFEKTIQSQFEKREYLFSNKNVLPDFTLKTLKAVQSVVGTVTKFDSWFDALHSMEQQSDKIDFDIALIGAGAYGMPLAAHIKRRGKIAIHMGGGLQCLFGIKGSRWEDSYYNFQNRFYNDYWVRPLIEETPVNYKAVDQGAYW